MSNLYQNFPQYEEFIQSIHKYIDASNYVAYSLIENEQLYHIVDTFLNTPNVSFIFVKSVITYMRSNINYKKYFNWITHSNVNRRLFSIAYVDFQISLPFSPFLFKLGVISVRDYIKIVIDIGLPDITHHIKQLCVITRETYDKIWLLVCDMYFEILEMNLQNSNVQQEILEDKKKQFKTLVYDMTVSVLKSSIASSSPFESDSFLKFQIHKEVMECIIKLTKLENFKEEFPDLVLVMAFVYKAVEDGHYTPVLIDIIPIILYHGGYYLTVFKILKENSTPDHLRFKVVELVNSLLVPTGDQIGNPETLLRLLICIKDDIYLYFKDEKKLEQALNIVFKWALPSINNSLVMDQCMTLFYQFEDIWKQVLDPNFSEELKECLTKRLDVKRYIESPSQSIVPLVEIGQLELNFSHLINHVFTTPHQYHYSRFEILNFILQKRINDPMFPLIVEYLKENIYNLYIDIGLKLPTIEILIKLGTETQSPQLQIYALKCVFTQISSTLDTNSIKICDQLSFLEMICNQYSQVLLDEQINELFESILNVKFFHACMIFEKHELVKKLFDLLFKGGPLTSGILLAAGENLKETAKINQSSEDPQFIRKYFTFILKLAQNSATIFIILQIIESRDVYVSIANCQALGTCKEIKVQLKPLVDLVQLFPRIFENICFDLIYLVSSSNILMSIGSCNRLQFILSTIPLSSHRYTSAISVLQSNITTKISKSNLYFNFVSNNYSRLVLEMILLVYSDQLDFQNWIQHILTYPKISYEMVTLYPDLLKDTKKYNLLMKCLEIPRFYNTREYLYSMNFLPIMEISSSGNGINQLPDILLLKTLKFLVFEKYQPMSFKCSLARVSKKFFGVVKKLIKQGFERTDTLSTEWYLDQGFYVNRHSRIPDISSPWCLIHNLRLVTARVTGDLEYLGIDIKYLENLHIQGMGSDIISALNLIDYASGSVIKRLAITLYSLDESLVRVVNQLNHLEYLQLSVENDLPEVTNPLPKLFTESILNRLQTLEVIVDNYSSIEMVDSIVLPIRPDINLRYTMTKSLYLPKPDNRVLSLIYNSGKLSYDYNEGIPKITKLPDTLDYFSGVTKMTLTSDLFHYFTSSTLPNLKKLTFVLNEFNFINQFKNLYLKSFPSLVELKFIINGVIQGIPPKIINPNISLSDIRPPTKRKVLPEKYLLKYVTNDFNFDFTVYNNYNNFSNIKKLFREELLHSNYNNNNSNSQPYLISNNNTPPNLVGGQLNQQLGYQLNLATNFGYTTEYMLEPNMSGPENIYPAQDILNYNNFKLFREELLHNNNRNSQAYLNSNYNTPLNMVGGQLGYQPLTLNQQPNSSSQILYSGQDILNFNNNNLYTQIINSHNIDNDNMKSSKKFNLKDLEYNSPQYLLVFLDLIHQCSNVKILKFQSKTMTFIHLLLPIINNDNIIISPESSKAIWYASNDYQTFYRI
ncbi:hypothetical protein DLAC_02436 [Tieghemostelium lacteum]|uniref:Uncharacterized protein n=1 Tax=Tieghemostelium lacteum TaxID=361077 RepID=A0A152A2G4_TIELA|nr:hypothetical protein DLAC_02436 [Tieghemostelium lacteum]|eukprot:KYR00442.1 hypothetical protein DLAC_02436 [Tieghemostelium lacteum]